MGATYGLLERAPKHLPNNPDVLPYRGHLRTQKYVFLLKSQPGCFQVGYIKCSKVTEPNHPVQSGKVHSITVYLVQPVLVVLFESAKSDLHAQAERSVTNNPLTIRILIRKTGSHGR